MPSMSLYSLCSRSCREEAVTPDKAGSPSYCACTLFIRPNMTEEPLSFGNAPRWHARRLSCPSGKLSGEDRWNFYATRYFTSYMLLYTSGVSQEIDTKRTEVNSIRGSSNLRETTTLTSHTFLSHRKSQRCLWRSKLDLGEECRPS